MSTPHPHSSLLHVHESSKKLSAIKNKFQLIFTMLMKTQERGGACKVMMVFFILLCILDLVFLANERERER